MAMIFGLCLPTEARPTVTGVRSDNAPAAPGDSIRVSLITCWPGPEVYELCGHSAIRVQSPGLDIVWNYGTFDFREPNFIGRFVSGQTDYKVISYPFEWFLPEYVQRGSRVEEQVINLPPEDRVRLLAALRRNVLPQNATYRYNYVKDNCATRITAMLEANSSRKIIFPDSARYGTFREVMRAYHSNYPWYQFGIDLVLGSGLDYRIDRKAEMFAPVEMHDAYAGAYFSEEEGDLVGETIVLNDVPAGNAILSPTPWYLTPMACTILILLTSIAVTIYTWKTGKLIKIWYAIFFAVTGLAGCVITYLVFWSSHEATSPNLNLIWLNPLQLVFAVAIWFRKARYVALGVALYDVAATATTLIAWHAQSQTANPAIFPLMAAMIILSAEYAIIVASGRYYLKGATAASAGKAKSNSRKRRRTTK